MLIVLRIPCYKNVNEIDFYKNNLKVLKWYFERKLKIPEYFKLGFNDVLLYYDFEILIEIGLRLSFKSTTVKRIASFYIHQC